MDRTDEYHLIARRLVEEYADHVPSNGKIEPTAIVDREKGHYQVVHLGWNGVRRVYGCTVHLVVKNGKFWVEYDGTNRPVVEFLHEAGVPREDVVLAFHPRHLRPLTGYAVE